MITWEEVVNVDPRVDELLERARHAGESDVCFCYQLAWDGTGKWGEQGFSDAVTQLVGWYREPLGSPAWMYESDAYELVQNTILHALPECRNCSSHQTDAYMNRLDRGLSVKDWC